MLVVEPVAIRRCVATASVSLLLCVSKVLHTHNRKRNHASHVDEPSANKKQQQNISLSFECSNMQQRTRTWPGYWAYSTQTHTQTHTPFVLGPWARIWGNHTHTHKKKGFFVMKTRILYTRIHPEIKREIAENAHLYYNSVNPRSVLVSHFIVRFR